MTANPPAQNRDDIRSGRGRQHALWLAASFAVLFASTIDAVFAGRGLGARLLCAAVGMALAVPGLRGFLRGARVRASNRRRWLAALAVIHLLGTLYFFPVQHLFDARPVVSVDHAVHYNQCLRAKNVFWSSLRLDCYSPYFMAGYPAGSIFDIDVKGAELFSALVPLPAAVGLKLFILFAYLTMLPSVYRGARMLGFRVEESALGAMLLLAYWHWGRPFASDFRFVGMFSFVFATHAVLYLTGLMRRFLAAQRGRTLFVVGPVAFLVHVLTVVMAAVSLSSVCIIDRARLNRRRLELLFLWALVVVFVNALWILPLLRFLPYKVPTEAYYQLGGPAELARQLWKPTGAVALALFALAIAGSWRLARARRAAVGMPCAVTSLSMLLLSACGVYLPGVDQLEPGRFLFSALVFAAPLAGVGAAWLIGVVSRCAGGARRNWVREAAVVGLALAPLPLAMLDAKAFYHHTLSVDLPPRVERFRRGIVSVVQPGARLMIEEGTARAYEGSFLPALLPSETRVEQIGGPYPHTPLLHHRITFDGDACLGVPFDRWDPATLMERLAFLRVRWIATTTDAATRFVAALPGVEVRWRDGPYTLWELPGASPTWKLEADYNRIRASLEVGTRPVVLPYHWVEGLRAEGGNEIVPVLRDDDPVPYVCVRRVRVTPVVIRY
jgi:hypothetical protein